MKAKTRIPLMSGAVRQAGIENIARFLAALPEDKRYIVEISERKRTRTIAQNRYLWAVAYEVLRQETGQSREDWHDYFLGEFFGWEEFELFGRKKIKPRRRSSQLTTQEFWEYVEFVQRKAAENGIYIPDPNEAEDGT